MIHAEFFQQILQQNLRMFLSYQFFNVDFIGNYHAVEYNNFLFRGIVDSFVTTLFISVKFSQFGDHNRFIGGLV